MFFRFASYAQAQLQTFGKTRFSSFAILISSLQRHQDTLERATNSPQYAALASKALKRVAWQPDEDDSHKDLEAVEALMADRETGLFNTRALPIELLGTKKYARIYQDIHSKRYWEALQVRVAISHVLRSEVAND